jgi:hypothetical protein
MFMRAFNPQPAMLYQQCYQLELRSHLDASWFAHLPVAQVTTGFNMDNKSVTVIDVDVDDQSKLISMLSELHGMGMTLLSVKLLPSPQNPPTAA